MNRSFCTVFALFFLLFFAAPATGSTRKVSFYGDIRFNTYWVKKSDELYNNGLGDTDSDLLWKNDSGNSRAGVRIKEGPISANVEIRPKNGAYYRQWWAQYDFGPAALLIGHTWVPTYLAFSKSEFDSHARLLYGDLRSRLRAPQMRLTVPFSKGKFILGLLNNPAIEPEWAGAGKYANYDTDVSLPEIEARLTLKWTPVQIDLFGGYGTYKAVDSSTEHSETVRSDIYGLRVIFPLGPAYLKGIWYRGTNPGNYGDIGTLHLNYRTMLLNTTTGQATDSNLEGYGGVMGYKINDVVSAEVGYFKIRTKRYLSEDDARAIYYLVLPIVPFKGVTISPEIGIRDEMGSTDAAGVIQNQGKSTYVGVYWRIAF